MSSDHQDQKRGFQAANPSLTSLQSSATVASTTPLNLSQQPQKDFASAFATLQSRYGTGGYIPSPKQKPSTKLPPAGSSRTPSDAKSSTAASPASSITQFDASSSGGQDTTRKAKKSLLVSFFKGKAKEKVKETD